MERDGRGKGKREEGRYPHSVLAIIFFQKHFAQVLE